MVPSLLVALPSVWLAASLAVLLQFGAAAALQGPFTGLLPFLISYTMPLLMLGLGVALFGNLVLGIEIMQGQRTFTLFLASFVVLLGTALWLVGLLVHPEWLWGQGHWLAVPVAALFMAGPCGTAAVIRMLHTETILETFLVLLLFIAIAAVSHGLVRVLL